MLNYNAETQTISMIAKDTGDFVVLIIIYLPKAIRCSLL